MSSVLCPDRGMSSPPGQLCPPPSTTHSSTSASQPSQRVHVTSPSSYETLVESSHPLRAAQSSIVTSTESPPASEPPPYHTTPSLVPCVWSTGMGRDGEQSTPTTPDTGAT